VSFCELTRTKRCGSNCELRLAANAAVYVVAAFEQIAEDGQELGFLELVQSNTEAAKLGMCQAGISKRAFQNRIRSANSLKGSKLVPPV
jgi:hypothetical protein